MHQLDETPITDVSLSEEPAVIDGRPNEAFGKAITNGNPNKTSGIAIIDGKTTKLLEGGEECAILGSRLLSGIFLISYAGYACNQATQESINREL